MNGGIEGRLFTFPVQIDVHWKIEGSVFGPMLPWRMPSFAGQYGRPFDTGSSEVLVLFESPYSHPAVGATPISQEAVEELQIQRYATDFAATQGALPYKHLERGDDPPDFKVRLPEDKSRGVDLTQLTFGKRRAAQARFERIRQSVLDAPRWEFAHLQGHMIFIWFTSESDLAAPGTDTEGVDDVLSALRGYSPDTSWTKLPSTDTPEMLPVEELAVDPAGFTFYAVEFEHAVPASEFFELRGFELGLAFQTRHSVAEAWSELRRIVQKHDKPKIDDLIVSVSGPSKSGLMFPSDEMLLGIAMDSGIEQIETEFLDRLILHEWSSGRITQVHPEVLEFRAIRPGGFVPAFYSLDAPPEGN